MRLFYRLADLLLKVFPPKETESVRENQMLLHPGIPGAELIKDYFEKKLGLVLAILTAGIVLSVIILIRDSSQSERIENSLIERSECGDGEKRVAVDLYSDGTLYQKEKIITVDERQYSAQEIRSVFSEVEHDLPVMVLGENQSVDHVDHQLNLPEMSDKYPVAIEWTIGDYEILDNRGHIQDDFCDENGRPVKLTASLSYEGYHEDYDFFVRVFPVYRTPEEKLTYEIDRSIREYSAKTISQNSQTLPDNVDGHILSYKRSLPHTWIYVLLTALLSAFVIYTGKDRDLKNEVEKREREMLLDYPEIVSRLTLLIGAGLTLRSAFEKVAMDYKNRTYGRKSFACEEMLITVYRMRSGVSEYEAYLDFGKRCAVKRYTKLGALFSQNIKKGSTGLLSELEREVRDAFEERKANARKRGEEAGTKLLLPMAMMLSVVMIIIIVPAFTAFSL